MLGAGRTPRVQASLWSVIQWGRLALGPREMGKEFRVWAWPSFGPFVFPGWEEPPRQALAAPMRSPPHPPTPRTRPPLRPHTQGLSILTLHYIPFPVQGGSKVLALWASGRGFEWGR